MGGWLLGGAVLAIAVVAGHGRETPGDDSVRARTESLSRQFVIHGGSLQLRTAIAGLAEATREALLKATGGTAEFGHPIVIELHGQPGDPAPARLMKPSFFILGNGFRLQLDLHLARGIDRDALQENLLELLLYERGLRGKGADEVDETLSISPWLGAGLLESFHWSANRGDRALYQALVERNALFPVERLLETTRPEELDAGTRNAFRASAGGLVMALIGQKGGKAAMDAMLADAATFQGEDRALLAKHFPGMNLGPKSLTKWWALQLARMAERPVWETMTIEETERALDKALVARSSDGSGRLLEFRPAQFRDLLALPAEGRREAVQPVLDDLAELSLRAFPGYRPTMAEYSRILDELANDTDEQVGERIAALEQARGQFAEMGERTRDYLDWCRITQGRQLSGAFVDYIKLKEKLEAEPSRRSGPVSKYLDDLQSLYEPVERDR